MKMKRWMICACVSLILLTACSASQESGDSTESAPVTASASLQATSDTSQTNETTQPVSGRPEQSSGTSLPQTGETLADFEVVLGKNKRLPFTAISQYPELPTGCEVTSLAMVFNYYNVSCDKCEIADNYLPKGEVGTVDFHEAFEGDPRDEDSYGCYANVIVKTAQNIISDKQLPMTVSDLTGASLEELFDEIDNNMPVIVWGTQDCQEGHYSVTWNVDGKELTWFTPEHCMVLTGYDENSVWVADPIYGDVRSYDKETFNHSYQSLLQQAVLLRQNV